jgi:hypothetical protein
MKRLFFIFFLQFVFISNSFPQIPRMVTYQGKITNASGAAITDGEHTISYSIYNIATGGTALFTESQLVEVTDGIFNMIIGKTKPIPASLSFDSAYYLGISIDNSAELIPRTSFTSAPYALHASIADALTHDAYIPPGLIIGSTAPSGNDYSDLSGAYPNPKVVALQGRPVADVIPKASNAFLWTGSSWAPGTLPGPVAFHVRGSGVSGGIISFVSDTVTPFFNDGGYFHFDSNSFFVPQTGVYRFDFFVNAVLTSQIENFYAGLRIALIVDGVLTDRKEYLQPADINSNAIQAQYASVLTLHVGQQVKFQFIALDNSVTSLTADLTGYKLK